MSPDDPAPTPSGLEDYLGHKVVVDTRTSYILIGTLIAIHRDCLTLDDADVHDTRDGSSTKDQYILEAHRLSISVNRRQAKVRLAVVVSVSRLEDVATF